MVLTPDKITPRNGEAISVERGRFYVPQDWGTPSLELELRCVRIRARSPQGNPPIVFLSGGPGESGIRYLSHLPFARTFLELSELHDVVLLDQRGCGSSGPSLDLPDPAIGPQVLADEVHLREWTLGRLKSLPRAGQVSVLQSASDVLELADALGAPAIHLLSMSYGTHLAQFVLRQGASRVDRTVLLGFEGPDQTFKYPSQLELQCERLGISAQHDFMGDLVSVLQDKGIRFSVSGDFGDLTVGRFALQYLVCSWCSLSNRFTRLPKIFHDLMDRKTESLAASLPDLLKTCARPAAFYLGDQFSGCTPARWREIEEEAESSPLSNAANFPFPLDLPTMDDEAREPLATGRPILCFTGELDGFTPTTNFQEVAELMPNATNFEVRNAGHNDLLTCAGVVDAAKLFFSGQPLTEQEYAVAPPVWPSF